MFNVREERSRTQMRESTIRLVMIDHHRSFVESLAYHINREASDLSVIRTATDAEVGLRIVMETKPEVVVLETELPGRGAFEVAAEVSRRSQETKIVFLTGYLSDVFIDQAFRVNARGYLLKSEPVDFVIRSIQSLVSGEYCFSKAVEERLEFDPIRKAYTFRSNKQLSLLTARQLEVLRHLAQGHSVKEVAKRMRLSRKSIDSHKYRIMQRLGIGDRVKLARFAIREGLTLP